MQQQSLPTFSRLVGMFLQKKKCIYEAYIIFLFNRPHIYQLDSPPLQQKCDGLLAQAGLQEAERWDHKTQNWQSRQTILQRKAALEP